MTAGAIRVLLVEDNDAYRDSLAFLLGRRDGIEIVGAVSSGEEAVAANAALEIDVAVLDFRLPGMGGAETAEALRERAPGPRIVFLSASAGAREREDARMLGVELVQKDAGVEALASAIRAARDSA